MLRSLTLGLGLLVLCGTVSVGADRIPNPVVDGNTKFAIELYQQLRTEKGNLFFSPYSVSSALGMTYLGARGETASEMKKVMHFPENDALNKGFLDLNLDINGTPMGKRGYELSVANALWGQDGYPWNKDFLATTKKFYGAGVNDVDFVGNTETARVTINEWVEKRTNDRIKNLLEQGSITPDTRMVLTNAIYFKGDWASQFKKDRTRPTAFKVSATESKQTPLMYQSGKFTYGEDADVQVLKLPYAGKELEMVVILPKKIDGLAAIEGKLTPETLNGWMSRTRTRTMDQVGLPKFKSENKFKLKDVLTKMGMVQAFGSADFSGIATKERLSIGQVIHQSFIEVNEQGTEAAAATAVEIRTTSAAINPDPRFIADHPFLYLIRDTRNGSILFLGRFVTPG